MLAHALVQPQQSVYETASRVLRNQHTQKSDTVKHVARGRVRASAYELSEMRAKRRSRDEAGALTRRP
jgi:hypothetical protein